MTYILYVLLGASLVCLTAAITTKICVKAFKDILHVLSGVLESGGSSVGDLLDAIKKHNKEVIEEYERAKEKEKGS